MREIHITAATLAAIEAHAVDCYPDECCGMIVESDDVQQVRQVTNVQNDRHAKDPAMFPRTARTAYTMGPEAARILIDVENGRLRLLAIYHSHPEHEAYFSAEDRTAALGGWDEPNYPQAGQIVLSVRSRTVRYAKAFAWDEKARDFIEVPLIVE